MNVPDRHLFLAVVRGEGVALSMLVGTVALMLAAIVGFLSG
jgi:hypothetical protein